jgi:hypothetical protein
MNLKRTVGLTVVCGQVPVVITRAYNSPTRDEGAGLSPGPAPFRVLGGKCLSSGHRLQLSRDIVHTSDQGVDDGYVAAGRHCGTG